MKRREHLLSKQSQNEFDIGHKERFSVCEVSKNSPCGCRCCVEGTLGSFENAVCWLDLEDPLRAPLSLPRRREALPFSLEEFTPLAGVEVSSRRDPSLGGTGGLEEDEEYRRWCMRVAPRRAVDGMFWVALDTPERGAHAARRTDVDNMVILGPSGYEEWR